MNTNAFIAAVGMYATLPALGIIQSFDQYCRLCILYTNLLKVHHSFNDRLFCVPDLGLIISIPILYTSMLRTKMVDCLLY